MRSGGLMVANGALVPGMQSMVRTSEAHTAEAVPLEIPVGSVLLGLLSLLVVLACLYMAFKIYVSLRGGKIAQGWLWFASGFGLLGLAQLLLVTSQVGLVTVSTIWVDLIRICALVFVLFGAGRIRKLLI